MKNISNFVTIYNRCGAFKKIGNDKKNRIN